MRYFSILFLTCVMATSLNDKPKVKENLKHYTITGDSVNALKSQMKKKGPKGFWGYTEWYVKWTGSCKVSVNVTITMPKLKESSKTPKEVRKEFDEMYAALLKHERNHGKNGIKAAQAVEKANCENTDPIFKKYNKADKSYDLKTKHGRTEGVKLP
ncbi:MAG: DUF922 domain-containing protein [Amylibacter sp.]|nr:DUF922 domain-containing protein [Amylibacter sp.]